MFGNLGNTSATGVAFTRNPSTGAREVYGEYFLNAQAEDVVAGFARHCRLTKQAQMDSGMQEPSLEEVHRFGQLQSMFRNPRNAFQGYAGC